MLETVFWIIYALLIAYSVRLILRSRRDVKRARAHLQAAVAQLALVSAEMAKSATEAREKWESTFCQETSGDRTEGPCLEVLDENGACPMARYHAR